MQLRRWTTIQTEETITEPMWLARLGRLVDMNCDKETIVPKISKPRGGHPWERVVRRRLVTLGMTLEDLAQKIDEPVNRIRLLFYYPPLWQSLEPRLSRALSSTSCALADAIERETQRMIDDRERKKAQAEQDALDVRIRRERAARRRERQLQSRKESR